ncbi:hypothetical protein FLL46_12395 [Aliikangiella coralliicola]|uniref:Chitin-binding type-3 domain-containing protein n=2 Tax=Aliikangiella coralliicola TaxID=2592383 RepID=A0A545UDA5_9GAMM|nr:hypothetical protein FLL46_12395 [Aliikangiella coralliicola]
MGVWYVKGDDQIYFKADSGCSEQSFNFPNRNLTEIHWDSENLALWAFDQIAGDLLRLNWSGELEQIHNLTQNNQQIQINGLSSYDGNLWLLTDEAPGQFVYELSTSDDLATQRSWKIELAGETDYTDIQVFDKYSAFISRSSDSDATIIQVKDKSAYTGDGPLSNTGQLSMLNTHDLPDEIRQPSGIYPRLDGGWWVATDQAEVFELTADFSEIRARVKLEFEDIVCNQGCIEMVVSTDGSSFYAISDSKQVVHYQQYGSDYQKAAEFSLEISPDQDFAGIAYNPDSENFYMVNNSVDEFEQDTLYVLDKNWQVQQQFPLSFNGNIIEEANEYNAEGIAYSNNKLYLLSAAFTEILVLSTEGAIEQVIDFSQDPISEPSDLSVIDNQLWMIGDNERNEPTAPVAVFSLPDQYCGFKPWLADKIYTRGDKVVKDGFIYRAKWWTIGDDPSKQYPWSVWKKIRRCGN